MYAGRVSKVMLRSMELCTTRKKKSLLEGSTHFTTQEFHSHLTIDTFLRASFFSISLLTHFELHNFIFISSLTYFKQVSFSSRRG